jgi:Transglycosylase SLT domain
MKRCPRTLWTTVVGRVGTRALGLALLGVLLGGTVCLAGHPPIEVSAKQKSQAAREVEKAARLVQERDYRGGLDRYLAALALDPYNEKARTGLAFLIGPIGHPEPQAAASTAVPAQEGPRRSTMLIAGTPLEDGAILGAIPGAPRTGFRTDGPYYAQARPYLRLVSESSQRHEVDPRLILGVIKVESNFNPQAMSPSGAVGLMQLMPGTAARFGCTAAADPAQNIDAGTAYLRYLLELFHGDVDRALAAYNTGEMTVVKQGGVPGSPALRQFVDSVKGYARRF